MGGWKQTLALLLFSALYLLPCFLFQPHISRGKGPISTNTGAKECARRLRQNQHLEILLRITGSGSIYAKECQKKREVLFPKSNSKCFTCVTNKNLMETRNFLSVLYMIFYPKIKTFANKSFVIWYSSKVRARQYILRNF